MKLNRWSLLLLFPLLLLLMGARQAPLNDPDPLAVPAGLSIEQVDRDVRRALISRGWMISEQRPGALEASLTVRAHVARITVSFDTKAVRVNYVSSENLKYEEHRKKGRLIHANYMSWINNLLTDISTNLQLTALG
jgi:hypothetical protein